MNCKFATPTPKSLIFPTITNHNQSESISFASHVSRSRISIHSTSGPRRARISARVVASYAATAESPYQVLGIEESVSSLSDVKKAYKKMARKYHPDVSPPDRVDENTRRFIMVKEAYETLSNPQRRASYDRNLAGVNDQGSEEKEEWKSRWQSQLDGLRKSSSNTSRRERMSWGARMRTQS